MLGKLLKHEFRSTGRFMLPIYGVVLVVTLLQKGILLFSEIEAFEQNILFQMASALISMLSVLLLVGMLFGTMFLVVQRFYKHLYSSEGYLSFTLPVTPAQHLNAKLISAFLWMVCSVLMVAVYLGVLLADPQMFQSFGKIFANLKDVLLNMPSGGWLVLIEFVLLMIVSLFAGILQFYASISLGQRMMPEKRILGSILAYFCIQIAMQMLMIFLMFFVALLGTANIASIQEMILTMDGVHLIQLALLGGLGLNLVTGGVFYYINYNTMKKHLNLE